MWNLYRRVRHLEKTELMRDQEVRQLAEEVRALAHTLKDADISPIRTYYGDSTIWRAAVSPDVSVRNVVLTLVDELGYKIGWDRGKAARVTLDPKGKK